MSSDVTVGICAYNEGKNISRLLNNILYEQKIPNKIEVLVVCSGCTDNTVKIVSEYSKRSPQVHYIIEKERKGKASAINKILSAARGSIILFVSADTLPNKDCFQKLVSKLQIPKVGIVSGNPVPINNPRNLVGRLVHLLWGFHDTVFRDLNDSGFARHASEIFCIRKEILEKIPVEIINDDAYMALMTKRKGWLIKYEPESRVSICGPQTFRDYFTQRRRVLFGHQQVRKMTGQSPQHLLYLFPLYPIRVAKLVKSLLMKFRLPTILTFLLVELAINVVAISDFISRKSHVKWNVSTSTKALASN